MLKDYEVRRSVGFFIALTVTPFSWCTNEDDMIGADEFNNGINPGDGLAELNKFFQRLREHRIKTGPHIRQMLAGGLLELVDKGVMEL